VACSVGAGYVGALTSLVLAALNPNITVEVCDVNVEQIRKWQERRYPFFEPQLEEYYEVIEYLILILPIESSTNKQKFNLLI
jgi:UDP-glucose 6-dehydrogenase